MEIINPQDEYYCYDSAKGLPIFGLHNNGHMCWWNSMLQMFLSCPAFIRILYETRDETYNKSLLSKYLLDNINALYSGETLPQLSQILFRSFIIETRRRKLTIASDAQEGVANGIYVFLNALGCDYIYKILNNRYEMVVRCPECKSSVSKTVDKSPTINMYALNYDPITTKGAFENWLLAHTTSLDSYRCEKCKSICPHRLEILTTIREVITIIFREKSATRWYPEFIDLPSLDDNMLRYKLIATIEHSGQLSANYQSGGHYWARAYRNGKWMLYNDTTVEPCNHEPTPQTHAVMYHLMELSPMTPEEHILYD